MHYFAYGSNMSLARLSERIPGVRRAGTGRLREHELRFHKVGQDGSAKCDAFQSRNPAHSILGALFEINPREKRVLDRVEGLGLGYDQKMVLVADDAGVEIPAFTYVATRIDRALKPFNWYKHHVLVGARESLLPLKYIQVIESVHSVPDWDPDREGREYGIHLVPSFAPRTE